MMQETILDQAVRESITARIRALTPAHSAQWGKMDVARMAEHCVLWNQWVMGKGGPRLTQNFIGKLIGKWALRRTLRPGKPFDRGIPAGKDLEVRQATGDLEAMKLRWLVLIDAYAAFNNPDFVHDFFGVMTDQEIGVFVYKHMDHHLRQFGV
jgi:hypothetical protein